MWSTPLGLTCIGTLDVGSSAYFNTTFAGVPAAGLCKPGYQTGATPPSRLCSIAGVWSSVTGTCNQLFCPSDNTDFNAIWPASTPAGQYAEGAFCPSGWTGIIGRQCQFNGQWATSATGGCTQVFCQPTSSGSVDGYASWPITAAAAAPVNVTVTSCAETYVGHPLRTCNPDGTWGPVLNPCTGTFAQPVCGAAHRPAPALRVRTHAHSPWGRRVVRRGERRLRGQWRCARRSHWRRMRPGPRPPPARPCRARASSPTAGKATRRGRARRPRCGAP